MTRAHSVLGVAASFNTLSFVYFESGELRYWGNHPRSARTLEGAFKVSDRWLARCNPKLVIVPDYDGTAKGTYARALVETVVGATENRDTPWIKAQRQQAFANKYLEAAALALVFPQIATVVPKPRKPWDTEPYGIVLFEALAITHTWLWQNNQTVHALPQ